MRIAFDIGNVLVDVDLEEFFTEFKRLGLREDPLAFLYDIQSSQDLGIDTIGTALKARFGLDEGRIKRLNAAWNRTVKPNNEMLDFVNGLKDRGREVAILSNMGIAHSTHIREKFPRIFDGCTLHLSSEVGARKPTKLYYQSFLMQHPRFKGCIFLDDKLENLAVAEEFGFKCRHFELRKFVKMSSIERITTLRAINKDIYALATQMLDRKRKAKLF